MSDKSVPSGSGSVVGSSSGSSVSHFCKYCDALIKWNGILWVTAEEVVFPQYCHDNSQNPLKNQKHEAAVAATHVLDPDEVNWLREQHD